MLFLGSGMLTQSEDMEIYTTCNSDLTIFFSLYFFVIKGRGFFSAATELHCENLLSRDL